MVPLSGKELESATVITVAESEKLALVVVAAVSKAAALVSVKDVSESLIPPLSLRVV